MISVRWTKHLKSQEQKQKFEERLALAKDIWNVLRDIIQEDLDAIERDGLNKEHYFMPAWSEYQADRNGSKRALSKLLAIIPKGE